MVLNLTHILARIAKEDSVNYWQWLKSGLSKRGFLVSVKESFTEYICGMAICGFSFALGFFVNLLLLLGLIPGLLIASHAWYRKFWE